jgi:hypothetical protein
MIAPILYRVTSLKLCSSHQFNSASSSAISPIFEYVIPGTYNYAIEVFNALPLLQLKLMYYGTN